jgi:hypothetical protein
VDLDLKLSRHTTPPTDRSRHNVTVSTFATSVLDGSLRQTFLFSNAGLHSIESTRFNGEMAERSKALASGDDHSWFHSLLVRKGVGSNPTLINISFSFWSCWLAGWLKHRFTNSHDWRRLGSRREAAKPPVRSPGYLFVLSRFSLEVETRTCLVMFCFILRYSDTRVQRRFVQKHELTRERSSRVSKTHSTIQPIKHFHE